MPDWSQGEQRAWEAAERLSPSVWMETAPVYIPANSINPEPGAYSFSRTPYLREIADLLIDPHVREIWIYKPTQVGFTRLLVNLICYLADQDPGALGLLMPDEDSAEELFAEELKPTIEATPVLKRRVSSRAWDTTKREIWLDSMPIFGLYAGSVQRLARRSLRYVALDEIDKYSTFSREASPIQLLKKRTSNWLHRARLIAGSTPTTPDGNIAAGFQACPDKRRYHLPCPKCGKLQNPIWSQVKGFKENIPGGDKWERADYIRRNPGLVYYECDNCRAAWPGQRDEKSRIVAAGAWVSDNPDTRGAEKIGMHTWGIVSPWLNLSDLAAEFIEAEGDPDRTRDFRNARLALPYSEVAKAIRPSVVREKRSIAPPPGRVPTWASVVVATADTQKDWFAYTIRAWGAGLKSVLIAHGQVLTGSFDDLYAATLGAVLPIEGGGQTQCRLLLIDSGGDRTEKVYEFARRDPRIIPTKGMNKPSVKLFYESHPKPDVSLWLLDSGHFKTALWNLIHDPDPTKWLPHREVSEQYCLEMASESLVRDKGKWLWKENGTARNEAWDCEVLQRAAADMLNVAQLAPLTKTPPPPEDESRRRPDGEPAPNWLTNHKGRW